MISHLVFRDVCWIRQSCLPVREEEVEANEYEREWDKELLSKHCQWSVAKTLLFMLILSLEQGDRNSRIATCKLFSSHETWLQVGLKSSSRNGQHWDRPANGQKERERKQGVTALVSNVKHCLEGNLNETNRSGHNEVNTFPRHRDISIVALSVSSRSEKGNNSRRKGGFSLNYDHLLLLFNNNSYLFQILHSIQANAFLFNR